MDKDTLLDNYQTIEAERAAIYERQRAERNEIEAKKSAILAEIGKLHRKFDDGDIVADRRGINYVVVGIRTEVWSGNHIWLVYQGRRVLKDGKPGAVVVTLYEETYLVLVKKAGETEIAGIRNRLIESAKDFE